MEAKKMTLGDILGAAAVSELNTGDKKIEYLPLHELPEDPDNFYSMDGIEELAANIATAGLLDPIVVYRHEDAWRVLSGHRRRAALLLLAKDEPEKYLRVPCIVDRREASPEFRELQLIFANSGTRKMSSADMATQVERVQELLYKLKGQGYEFPGKMRQHVAEACQISESKIARLSAIRSGLAPELYANYYEGDRSLNESTAYALSQLPEDVQQKICSELLSHSANGLRWLYAAAVDKIQEQLDELGKLRCHAGGEACNIENKTRHIVRAMVKDQFAKPYCSRGCCEDCPQLQSCKDVCPMLKAKQGKMKADAKADAKRAADAKSEKERPDRERISGIYLRFSYLLDKSGVSVKDYLAALQIPYAGIDDATIEKRCYSDGVQPTTDLPFSYSFSLDNVKRLCKAADLLGCSIDYLLCRTDELHGAAPVSAWHGADERPDKPCDVVADFLLPCNDGGKPIRRTVRWDGEAFQFHGNGEKIDMEPIRWMAIPEVE